MRRSHFAREIMVCARHFRSGSGQSSPGILALQRISAMFPKTYRGPAEAMQPCQHGADGKARQPCTFPMPLPAKVSVIYRGPANNMLRSNPHKLVIQREIRDCNVPVTCNVSSEVGDFKTSAGYMNVAPSLSRMLPNLHFTDLVATSRIHRTT